MSIRLMSLVFGLERLGDQSLQPTEKLVLLSLADWANDEGGSLHPSMGAIARKACLSVSQARRIVHGFIAVDVLAVLGNARGGAPGTTPQYRLNVARLTACADATPRMDATPTPSTDARPSADARACMDAREGLHGCAETACMGASQSTIEPPENRQEDARASRTPPASPATPSRSKGLVTFRVFVRSCQDAGEPTLSETDAVWAYAERVGIPADLLELAWKEFAERYRDSDKRYRDWRIAFRNAVRDNWFGIWAADGNGGCVITSKGRQAQSAHRAVLAAAVTR